MLEALTTVTLTNIMVMIGCAVSAVSVGFALYLSHDAASNASKVDDIVKKTSHERLSNVISLKIVEG